MPYGRRLPAGSEGESLAAGQAIRFCCQEVTWAGTLPPLARNSDRSGPLRSQDHVPVGLSRRRLHASDGQDPPALRVLRPLIEEAGVLGELPDLGEPEPE